MLSFEGMKGMCVSVNVPLLNLIIPRRNPYVSTCRAQRPGTPSKIRHFSTACAAHLPAFAMSAGLLTGDTATAGRDTVKFPLAAAGSASESCKMV
jgi:hypothetical protein